MKSNQEPLSDHEARQILYWSRLANSDLDSISAAHWIGDPGDQIEFEMFSDIARWCLHHFRVPTENPEILEIGCGNGLLLKAFSEISTEFVQTPRFYGTDLSLDLIKRCVISVPLVQAPANKQPFKNNSFDLIVMHSVVQYFESNEYLQSVLTEVNRLLRPGGMVMILDIPNSHLKEYMSTQRKKSVRERIFSAAPKLVKIGYTRLKFLAGVKKDVRKERIGHLEIEIPEFAGLYCEPEFFVSSFSQMDMSSEVHVQTYKSKPLIYRKFRFNVIARMPTN